MARARMTKRVYQDAVALINDEALPNRVREVVSKIFRNLFQADNPAFDRVRFDDAVRGNTLEEEEVALRTWHKLLEEDLVLHDRKIEESY